MIIALGILIIYVGIGNFVCAHNDKAQMKYLLTKGLLTAIVCRTVLVFLWPFMLGVFYDPVLLWLGKYPIIRYNLPKEDRDNYWELKKKTNG